MKLNSCFVIFFLLTHVIIAQQNEEYHKNLGNEAAQKKNYLDAIKHYDNAISINPKYADAYNNKGVAYWSLGQRDNSFKNLEKALEIDPNHKLANHNYGKYLFLDSKYSKCLPYLEKAVKLDPQNIDWKDDLIDAKSTVVVYFECPLILKYDRIDRFENGFAVTVLDKKYGFINTSYKDVVKPTYELAFDYSEGLAVVKQNGKYGYINTMGQIAIPIQYDFAASFSEELACVLKNNEWFYIDKNAKKHSFSFPYNDILALYDFKNGLAGIAFNNSALRIIKNEIGTLGFVNPSDSKAGNAGFIDKNGKIVIPLNYNFVGGFNSKGYANVKTYAIYSNGKLVKEEEEYCIDKNNNKVVCEEDRLFFNGNPFFIKKQNGKKGVVDKFGNIKIPFLYYSLKYFPKEELFYAQLYDGANFKVLDINGNKAIEQEYQYMMDFENGFALVKLNNQFFIINKNGQIVTRYKYSQLDYTRNNPIIYYGYSEGKTFLINYNGKEVILNEELIIMGSSGINNVLKVYKEGKYGFIRIPFFK